MKIQNYTIDAQLNDSDMIIGTDGAIGTDFKRTKNFTLGDLKNYMSGASNYKVYTALLTQVDRGKTTNISSGSLTVGVTYQILDDGGGSKHDFTNLGAPNNNFGTYFVATKSSAPNSWGINVFLQYNDSTPVAIVLENTIGNIWFEYQSAGFYKMLSDGLFTQDKVYYDRNSRVSIFSYESIWLNTQLIDSSIIFFNVTDGLGGAGLNDSLDNTPFEIRIYN